MDKRKVRQYEARLTEQRNALLGMVERTEDYGREADRDVSQDPADKASNSYTKELLFSQSTNERNTLRLIEEALTLTRHELLRHGVALRVELAADLPPVEGDAVGLQPIPAE